MIGVIFQFGSEVIEVRVAGNNCVFRNSQYGGAFAPIEALKLDKSGVIKEFPDLNNDDEWKRKATERFKDKLKKLKTDEARMEYIIDDLKKFGYKALYYCKKGHRPLKLT